MVADQPSVVASRRPTSRLLSPADSLEPSRTGGAAAGAPCVYWLLGGADPAVFEGAADFEEIALRTAGLPSSHSPLYAPVIEPTLTFGVNALVAAAHTWMPSARGH